VFVIAVNDAILVAVVAGIADLDEQQKRASKGDTTVTVRPQSQRPGG